MRCSLCLLPILALAAPLAAQAPVSVAPLGPGETLLEVSQTGEARAVPDVAEFNAEVAAEAATPRAALAAAAARADQLVRAAEAAGVPARDLRTEAVRVQPHRVKDRDGDETGPVLGYAASTRFRLRLTELGRAPAVVDALVDAGATSLSGPDFSFADEAPVRARARRAAVEAALREASDYAAALGRRVGRVLRVSERGAGGGAADIVVTGSRKGLVPLQPGEQVVTVTVWMDVALVAP